MSSPPFVLPADSDLSGIGIYNVLDQNYCGGMIPNSPSAGVQNACALQAAIDQASVSGGGMIFIPRGVYYVTGTVYIGANASPDVAVSLTIIGTSGNTTLIQTTNGSVLFDVNTQVAGAGNDDIDGVTFQDLLIEYFAGATLGIAIKIGDVTAAQNVRIFRVVFSDCPQAVVFISTLQCSMLQCTVTYIENEP